MPVLELCDSERGGWINYEVHGSHDAPEHVVCVNGFMTALDSWHGVVADFGDELDKYQFCIIDNRGVGGSSDPPTLFWSTRHMAADAFAVLNHLGWCHVHVIGVSMGGMIAQELALMLRSRVKSLTLGVTHAGGIAGFPPVLAPWLLLRTFLRGEDGFVPAVMDMLYGDRSKADPALRERLRQANVHRMRTSRKPSQWAFWGQVVACWRHYTRHSELLSLRSYGYPVLVMGATQDKLVRASNSHLIARALGVPVLVFNGAGHGVMYECRPQVHDAFSTHLRLAAQRWAACDRDQATRVPRTHAHSVARLLCTHRGPCVGHVAVGALRAGVSTLVLLRAADAVQWLVAKLSRLLPRSAAAAATPQQPTPTFAVSTQWATRIALLALGTEALRRGVACTTAQVRAWYFTKTRGVGDEVVHSEAVALPFGTAAVTLAAAVVTGGWLRQCATYAAAATSSSVR